ncbi:C2H2-type domain-containing protein [Citrus sinensis]|uniref:C2H2-type domain-containing protein n=1 Tax=Citrus sinensis TaxID=2711 RepID=A0ACB8K9B7_CITSI|nr:C2H2-type domain-containing protein [Citrus sinensis]
MYSDHLAPKTFADLTNTSADTFETEKPVERVPCPRLALCDLGQSGNSSICNQTYCSVCGIIKSGFSPKLDGISTLSSRWRALVAIPEEIEEEFKFMNLKRAMLVCRVVAGRVGCDADDDVDMAKENGGFDSVVGRGAGGVNSRVDDDEELLVFNPKAVLPCFVIVYTV